jgi:hypothetical protein
MGAIMGVVAHVIQATAEWCADTAILLAWWMCVGLWERMLDLGYWVLDFALVKLAGLPQPDLTPVKQWLEVANWFLPLDTFVGYSLTYMAFEACLIAVTWSRRFLLG